MHWSKINYWTGKPFICLDICCDLYNYTDQFQGLSIYNKSNAISQKCHSMLILGYIWYFMVFLYPVGILKIIKYYQFLSHCWRTILFLYKLRCQYELLLYFTWFNDWLWTTNNRHIWYPLCSVVSIFGYLHTTASYP